MDQIPGNLSLKDKFSLADDRLVFVYAGLLSKGRGIEILLDLFSTEFDGTDLVFLGHGELKHLV